MKSFLDVIKEEQQKEKHHVLAFGRMNPPTTGHLKLVDKVKSVAAKHKATHTVVVSHSQDSKKNPLSGEQKVKHLNRYSPVTHFEASSKEKPTILHHAAEAAKKGVTHLHVVGGSDRVKEYHQLLHKYNGVKGTHGHYNFKKITVHSAGHRDPDSEGTEGMSASKMREHAKNKDFHSFRQGVPSHVADHHAKELMHDVRKGMGLHESYNRGMFKAIFVTGGPGSGKDVVLREAIPDANAVEISLPQAFEYLADKQKLCEKSDNYRRETLRNRGLLIINGPADSTDEMLYVKEELEELGYYTAMVFVNTSDEVSQERNTRLSRMMVESIRQDKWLKSQKSKNLYESSFDDFIYFNNNSSIEDLEEDITDTYQKINTFIDRNQLNETAHSWMNVNKNNTNNSLLREEKNVQSNVKKIGSGVTRKTLGNFRAKGPADITPDNAAGGNPAGQGDSIKGDTFPRKDPNGKGHSGGGWRGAYSTEEKIQIFPEPKKSNFSKDKEVTKKKRFTDSPSVSHRLRNTTGIGPEFDTRQQGTVYPMSGLGDVTYRESIDHGATEMGVAGVMGGASNKENMDTYSDTNRNIGTIVKKKKVKK